MLVLCKRRRARYDKEEGNSSSRHTGFRPEGGLKRPVIEVSNLERKGRPDTSDYQTTRETSWCDMVMIAPAVSAGLRVG
jgi:hypothetical protein